MRRAGPPRYFQEDGSEDVSVSLFLRGTLEEVSAVVEGLRSSLEIKHSPAVGELLAELTISERALKEYDQAIREVLELDFEGSEDE